ncbi:MAG: hypothetical protein OXE94_14435 [Aestuariivita sp.]|nr:hypothetical protein [Aestuariivita sp.]MCY4202873.1 hypothetical protein [Aestuariivita sp.]
MSERQPSERTADPVVQSTHNRYERLSPYLDERSRRLFAATEASAFGRGGSATVAKTTGLARSPIRRGIQELDGSRPAATDGPVRRQGGGPKTVLERQPSLRQALQDLVEPATRVDPEKPLL